MPRLHPPHSFLPNFPARPPVPPACCMAAALLSSCLQDVAQHSGHRVCGVAAPPQPAGGWRQGQPRGQVLLLRCGSAREQLCLLPACCTFKACRPHVRGAEPSWHAQPLYMVGVRLGVRSAPWLSKSPPTQTLRAGCLPLASLHAVPGMDVYSLHASGRVMPVHHTMKAVCLFGRGCRQAPRAAANRLCIPATFLSHAWLPGCLAAWLPESLLLGTLGLHSCTLLILPLPLLLFHLPVSHAPPDLLQPPG